MEGEAYNKLNSEKTYAYAPGTYLTQSENVILVYVQILIPPTTGKTRCLLRVILLTNTT